MPEEKKVGEVKDIEPKDTAPEELEIVEPKAKAPEGKPEPDVKIVDEEDEEEDEGYKAKAKPELTPDEQRALAIRANKRAKKPKFRRQEWFRYAKLDERWRKPRGLQSKLRRNYKYRPPKVSKGYRVPKTARGRHPSGFEDILVHSPKDLEGLDPKKQAVRIGHTVGTKKRLDIKEKADEMGIRILNWGA